MSLVSIPMPEDLEQVLKAVLERDPNKGTEWLKAGFEARLTEIYQQWQALQLSTARFAELLVVLGRNNPSLYTVNGRPLYAHLNGLAIV